MDVEKLPETLTSTAAPACPCLDRPASPHCRPGCSLEVVDRLLSEPAGISGEDADCLLDLRRLLQARMDAEATLSLFCELRRRLEHKHYLLFYRLRRWLEMQLLAEVRPSGSANTVVVPVSLDFYCVEAIRRVCLCAALNQCPFRTRPKLTFAFVPLPGSEDERR